MSTELTTTDEEEDDGVSGGYGEAGVADRSASLIIGKPPEIRRTATKLSPAGDPLEWKTSLDMNPVTISYARLFEMLENARHAGKPTQFLGHVMVKL